MLAPDPGPESAEGWGLPSAQVQRRSAPWVVSGGRRHTGGEGGWQVWRPGSGARRGLRAEGGVRATPLSRRAGRDSGFRAGIRARRMAGPSGGTERRQPSGSQAAGGAAAPRFAPGPPPPLIPCAVCAVGGNGDSVGCSVGPTLGHVQI